MADGNLQPRIMRQTAGRALFIAADGACYIARKYDILASNDWGTTWRLDCRVPPSGWKPWVAAVRPFARLLRYNIQAFQVLEDGTRLAVARDGIYRAGPGEIEMTRVFAYTRGSRPINLCADGPRVLFGEYGDGFGDSEIFLYVSEDFGRSWQIAYRFPPRNIRHVHNVIFDARENHYWVLVGDFDSQPGIGALSKDLTHIDWLSRGNLELRAVGAIVTPECLYYGMDSDRERNFIIRLEKRTGKMTKLLEVEGSSLYAATFGQVHVISTCVEPNPACPAQECALYVSRDGDRWQRMLPHRKDSFNPWLFQFGCLVLPYSYCSQSRGMFSGQAVVGAHNKATLLDFSGSGILNPSAGPPDANA
jgi:hypothetical protein